MNAQLYKNIANSTAHRASRDENAKIILDDQSLLADLLQFIFDIQDKNHHKACWILELVLEQDIEWLSPFLDVFCEKLPQFSHESAVRSISKICMFAVVEQQRKIRFGGNFLTEKQQQQIAESCFDWLIGNFKVATKAYAARALFVSGKTSDWIYPELSIVLENDFGKHSAAYKAVAREILKVLSNKKKPLF